MPSRTINEAPSSTLLLRSDGTVAGTTAAIRIEPTEGVATQDPVDIPAALATAAAAIGGGRTAAEVRECVRQFFVAARAQGRTAGGWTGP
jgi:hypothetical protein